MADDQPDVFKQASPLDDIGEVGPPIGQDTSKSFGAGSGPTVLNTVTDSFAPQGGGTGASALGTALQETGPARFATPLDDIGEIAPSDVSTAGAAARGAVHGAIPAAGAMAGAGAGAEAGAAGGALVAPFLGPFAPAGPLLGGLAGGIAGAIGGGMAAEKAQDYTLSKLPDSVVDAFGQGDRQQQLDQQYRGGAYWSGGMLPFVLTMQPTKLLTSAAALPEGATALQRLMANPVTARLFGGGVMGGMELGQEATQGQVDWRKVGIATGFGIVFNKPNALGEAITEMGAAPARRLLGRPVERPPTIAQAADTKIMGPGITEAVFQGSHEQAPEAAMAAQQTARDERAAQGDHAEPDMHAIARQMEPELFARYDELQARQKTFRAQTAPGGEELPALDSHLAATNAELEKIAPEIAAAYRRAADTAGVETVPAEPHATIGDMLAEQERGPNAQAPRTEPGAIGIPPGGEAGAEAGGPEGTAGPVAPGPQRSIGDQRAFIADDVARRLIAAGRPEDEARATGHVVAARYVTRAGRFDGKLGSAEELYAKDGAAIAGPNGKALVPGSAAAEQAPRGAPSARELAQSAPHDLDDDETSRPRRNLRDPSGFVSAFPKEFDAEETRALKNYKGMGEEINTFLRTGEENVSREKIDEAVSGIDNAFKRSNLKDSTSVYRGVTDGPYADLTDADAGKIITEKSFMSTSLRDDEAENFTQLKHHKASKPALLDIQMPKGMPAINMDAMPPHDAFASEILFPRGLQFEVLGSYHTEGSTVPTIQLRGILPEAVAEGQKDLFQREHRPDHDIESVFANLQKALETDEYHTIDSEGNRVPASSRQLLDRMAEKYGAETDLSEWSEKDYDAYFAAVDREASANSDALKGAGIKQSSTEAAKDDGFDTSKEFWHGTTHGLFTNFRESTAENDVLGPAIYLGSTKGLSEFYGPGRGGDMLGPFHVRGNIANENTMVPRDPDKYPGQMAKASQVMGTLKADLERPVSSRPSWGKDMTPAQYAREFWKRRGVDGYDSGFEVAIYDPKNVRAGFSIEDGQIRPAAKDQKELFQKQQLPPTINSGPYAGETTPLFGKTLYHETSPENAAALIREDLTNEAAKIRPSNLFLADNPDIAIGQGGGGVRIEYEGDLVSGSEHVKPGTGDVAGREYRANGIGNSAIRKITIAPGEKMKLTPAWDRRLNASFDKHELPDGSTVYESKDQKELFQTANASIRPASWWGWNPQPFDRSLIKFFKSANASSGIHEFSHGWLEEMRKDSAHPEAPQGLRDDMQTVNDWLGVGENGEIKTKQHEKFARGVEQYMREGVAPSKELAGVFAQFRNWLLQIYQSLKGLGTTEISPEMRGVFDRMLEMEPQRTVIAPERLQPDLLHDIHEADAAHTPPHEAEPAMDRIIAERDRYITEQPPEIQRELETAAQKVQAAQGPAGEAAGAPGEAFASPGGPGQVGEGGGGPGPEPGGGGGGAEHGAQQPGGGGTGAESNARPDTRSQLDRDPGTALAPGPAQSIGGRSSPFTDKAGNIRLENLTNSADVRQAIHDAADENNDFIGDRRGVVTDGQVSDLANDIGLPGAMDMVSKWVKGQAYNAEQVVVLRRLLRSSAVNLSEKMKQAAIGTDEDVMAYAEARDRHQLIQRTVAGATAEAGRALRAFRNIAGEEGTAAKALNDLVKIGTGKTLFQLKAEAKMGAKFDTPEKISKFMQDAQKRNFGRSVLEYFVNALISGPITHITYGVGNEVSSILRAGPETLAAAAIGHVRKALGREGEVVHAGEALAQYRARYGTLPASIQSAMEAARTGMTTLLPGEEIAPGHGALTPFEGDTSLATAKSMTNAPVSWNEAMASAYGAVRGIKDAFWVGGTLNDRPIGLEYSPLGQIPDVRVGSVNIPIGTSVRLPGRLVAAEHSFFRTANYAMERSAEAYRIATDEGRTGSARNQRIAEIELNPNQEQMDRWIAASTHATLMGQGGAFVRKLSAMINHEFNVPGIGPTPMLKFMDPFIKISGNIIEQSLIQRTPIGLLSQELRADLMGKNGNIAQDKAQARMLVGTGLALLSGSLAAQGYVTGSGPSDPKEAAMWQLAGNQAHSVRIGDFWYQINKLGPYGVLTGIAADLYDVSHEASDGDMLKAAMHLQHAFTQNILDESFMKGPADLIKAVDDPGRYGENYIKSFASSFTPFSSGFYQVNRMMDPYQRETRSVVDAIKAKLPGLSETLMPRRDVWGQPMPSREGAGYLTSIYVQKMNDDPVNRAMLEAQFFPGQVEKKIRNIELTPEEHDDFARIAGTLTKHDLDKVVTSQRWQDLPMGAKQDLIKHAVEANREVARGIIMYKLYPHIWTDAQKQQAQWKVEGKKK